MRPIKFRGKCIEEGNASYGEFVYGDLRIIEDKRDFYLIYTINSCVRVDKNTTGQFTGLFDNKGVEIYEGDIVIYYDDDEYYEYEYEYGVVKWQGDDYYPAFDLNDHIFEGNALNWLLIAAGKHIEVIGNIHDNPELLEKK